MARILILGGTAWLGREVAAQAVRAGHDVTCLARGTSGAVAPGARLVSSDRDEPGAYDRVTGQDWDLVVDVSWQPAQVRSALAALAPRARHWAYVSSCSVYADNSRPGADETTALLERLDRDTAELADYGPAKVACEEACRAGVGDRLLVARAGLIGGFGDGSDRFGYWPWRFERAGAADVLVPDALDAPTQTIDVGDLAAWLVRAGLAGTRLTANAVGAQRTLGEVLDACRAMAGHSGRMVPADEDWLEAHDVRPWAGPRSLPLWVPGPDWAGFGARDSSAAPGAGLQDCGLDGLVARSLEWERSQPRDRERKAGLTDAEEAELLAALCPSTASVRTDPAGRWRTSLGPAAAGDLDNDRS
jgi:2'-hydroxyisoflavone reductase